jgi:hypothetical protein
MKIPDHLYKYRFFDRDNMHLRILTHNEIFFSSPARFNNPFDSKIPLDYSTGTKEEIIEYWSKHLLHPESHPPPGFKIDKIEELYDQGYFASDYMRKRALELTKNYGAKALGIFSLSANDSNILMWSHYSLAHSGFLVKFSSDSLREFCRKSTFDEGIITALDIVQYDTQMPKISAYRNTQNERFASQFLTKAIDWKYEEEYRILRHNSPDTVFQLPMDSIRGVILGCQIEEANKQKVIEILKGRGDKLPLYQANTAHLEFRLEFNQVIY